MSTIYFYFYFAIGVGTIFTIVGLVVLFKKKELLGRLFGALFLLIGLVKVTQFLIAQPSLAERKIYYSELESLKIEEIREVEIINLSSKKKVVVERKDIPILLTPLSDCKSSIFEFRQTKFLEHFKVVFHKIDGEELMIKLTETNRGVSFKNIIYNEDGEEFNIGKYRCSNPNIVSRILSKTAN